MRGAEITVVTAIKVGVYDTQMTAALALSGASVSWKRWFCLLYVLLTDFLRVLQCYFARCVTVVAGETST